MPRRALLAALALAGCAPKLSEPKVVALPSDLARPGARRAPETADGQVRPTDSKPIEKVPGKMASRPAASVSTPSQAHSLPFPQPRSRIGKSAAAVAVRTGSVESPMIPKADETRRLGYRIEGSGALELEGVCRFSESEVSCWDSGGKDLPSLRSQIESALSQPDQGADGLAVRFGRKNRIIVVRREQAISRGGPMKTLNLQSIGTDPRQGGGYINLPSETPNFDANKPMVSHEARALAFDRDAKETQMRVMVYEPIPDPPEITLRKGASASVAGCRFTVVAIEKGVPKGSPMFINEPGEVWTVRLTRSGTPSRPASFSVHDEGRLYRDASGKLVDAETYRKWMQEAQRKGDFDLSKSPFQPVRVSGYGMGTDGALTIVLSADPKLVKTVHLYGSFMRTVDLTGIPLDPR